MSAAARKRISAAQRKRWAAVKKAQAKKAAKRTAASKQDSRNHDGDVLIGVGAITIVFEQEIVSIYASRRRKKSRISQRRFRSTFFLKTKICSS